MLWLINGRESMQITGCNTHAVEQDGEISHQLWVEKPSGKTRLIRESTDRTSVNEVRDAIDYAVRKEIRTLELDS